MNPKLIQGLRDLADFLEGYAVPDGCHFSVPEFYVFASSRAAFTEAARQFGTARKSVKGSYFNLTKNFGPLSLELTIQRPLVCERVKTGERIIPAVPERVLPAEAEKIEEVFEWKCPESILKSEVHDPESAQAIAASVAAVGF